MRASSRFVFPDRSMRELAEGTAAGPLLTKILLDRNLARHVPAPENNDELGGESARPASNTIILDRTLRRLRRAGRRMTCARWWWCWPVPRSGWSMLCRRRSAQPGRDGSDGPPPGQAARDLLALSQPQAQRRALSRRRPGSASISNELAQRHVLPAQVSGDPLDRHPDLRMSQMVCFSASLNLLTAEPPVRRRHCSPIRPVLQRPPEDTRVRGHSRVFASRAGSCRSNGTCEGRRDRAAG
jgi:hypothetical protein